MYCSTCGQQIDDHLNYCKSCGARIEKPSVDRAPSHDINKTLGVVMAMGIIGFVAVAKIVLDNQRLDVPGMVMILLGYLAALTIISSMIIRHIWRTTDGRRAHTKPLNEADYASPASFRGPNTNQLGEPIQQPIGSVTDNTTRTLDEVLIERR
jgi:hypothetical protein